jgi:L-asparaginase
MKMVRKNNPDRRNQLVSLNIIHCFQRYSESFLTNLQRSFTYSISVLMTVKDEYLCKFKHCTMAIRIFITGGTFDKEYNELNGELYFKDTHLQELLTLGRSRLPVSIKTLMMIDSLEMTAEHRSSIANECRQCEEDKIVITHGTDTMAETARVLAQQITGKTIVLTGAMIPIKFGSSDGLFNLGSALAFVQSLPHGVYVAMNGRYFNWDNVRKNRQTGSFEELKAIPHP